MTRGTRPTGPRPWPRVAEGQRQGAYDAAALIGEQAEADLKALRGILRRAREVGPHPQANIYLTKKFLEEIAEAAEALILSATQTQVHAEYARRLLAEARHGDAPDPALATVGEAVADHEARIAALEAELAALRGRAGNVTPFPSARTGTE